METEEEKLREQDNDGWETRKGAKCNAVGGGEPKNGRNRARRRVGWRGNKEGSNIIARAKRTGIARREKKQEQI